ncbi:MAG: hypothetical protein IT436_18790 [Phycisphaerales bacterium]|nr:hypothetical protein [Phycisphaerales bacterium]
MKRPEIMLWTVVLAAATITLAGLGRSARAAQHRAQLTVTSLRGLTERVREYRRLEAQTAALPQGRDGTSLAEEVAGVLSASGLPPSALASLSPDSAQSSGTGPLVRLRAGMTLTKVTLPQLGRFLSEWRRRQADVGGWTVTDIDLSPESGVDAIAGSAGTGRDLPLRAVMSLESIAAEGAEP